MATAYEVNQQKLVEIAKEELKNLQALKPPAWASFVKTGVSRERPPQQQDWWYSRAASVLRHIYREGPIGAQRLRNAYGGRKNRGHKPERFRAGGGSSVRKILQQLEIAGLIRKESTKGRVVTPQGQRFLDNVAKKITKGV